jgi:Calpain family cysteine protease
MSIMFEERIPINENQQEVNLNVGVSNPYAVAELVMGRKIDWAQVEDVPKLLEDVLQTPYAELFDPKFEGPLYFGSRLNKNLQMEAMRSPLFDIKVREDGNDLEFGFPQHEIHRLADLKARFEEEDTNAFIVTNAEVEQGYVNLRVRLRERSRAQILSRVFTPEIVQAYVRNPALALSDEFLATLLNWSDMGRFFNEATEYFDPIQGAVGDCYFIAALSSVAWARPLHIANMNRAGQQSFKNMIRFYRVDSGGVVDREVEVTDRVPLDSRGGTFLYARSSEAGEIWPAIYEKAYAKWRLGTAGDFPNIPAIAGGDPVAATSQLTGGRRQYIWTSNTTADALWTKVRSHSLSYRTFDPMVAWTYPSGDASPDKVNYNTAGIAANHAYSILGWEWHNGNKYIILRNPWGFFEGTVGALNTTWASYDVSWWRPITLNAIDGVFAMEASAFKRHFAGMGVAV